MLEGTARASVFEGVLIVPAVVARGTRTITVVVTDPEGLEGEIANNAPVAIADDGAVFPGESHLLFSVVAADVDVDADADALPPANPLDTLRTEVVLAVTPPGVSIEGSGLDIAVVVAESVDPQTADLTATVTVIDDAGAQASTTVTIAILDPRGGHVDGNAAARVVCGAIQRPCSSVSAAVSNLRSLLAVDAAVAADVVVASANGQTYSEATGLDLRGLSLRGGFDSNGFDVDGEWLRTGDRTELQVATSRVVSGARSAGAVDALVAVDAGDTTIEQMALQAVVANNGILNRTTAHTALLVRGDVIVDDSSLVSVPALSASEAMAILVIDAAALTLSASSVVVDLSESSDASPAGAEEGEAQRGTGVLRGVVVEAGSLSVNASALEVRGGQDVLALSVEGVDGDVALVDSTLTSAATTTSSTSTVGAARLRGTVSFNDSTVVVEGGETVVGIDAVDADLVVDGLSIILNASPAGGLPLTSVGLRWSGGSAVNIDVTTAGARVATTAVEVNGESAVVSLGSGFLLPGGAPHTIGVQAQGGTTTLVDMAIDVADAVGADAAADADDAALAPDARSVAVAVTKRGSVSLTNTTLVSGAATSSTGNATSACVDGDDDDGVILLASTCQSGDVTVASEGAAATSLGIASSRSVQAATSTITTGEGQNAVGISVGPTTAVVNLRSTTVTVGPGLVLAAGLLATTAALSGEMGEGFTVVVNGEGAQAAVGISASRVANLDIGDVTITVLGAARQSSVGIAVGVAVDLAITNSTILAGAALNSAALRFSGFSNRVVVEGNTLVGGESASDFPGRAGETAGVRLIGACAACRIANNTIAGGDSDLALGVSHGLLMAASATSENSVVAMNLITAGGASSSIGLEVAGDGAPSAEDVDAPSGPVAGQVYLIANVVDAGGNGAVASQGVAVQISPAPASLVGDVDAGVVMRPLAMVGNLLLAGQNASRVGIAEVCTTDDNGSTRRAEPGRAENTAFHTSTGPGGSSSFTTLLRRQTFQNASTCASFAVSDIAFFNSLAPYNAAVGVGTSLAVDALIVDDEGRLSATSPLIDQAPATPAYLDGVSSTGIVDVDLDGRSRPLGNAHDIGRHEQSSP